MGEGGGRTTTTLKDHTEHDGRDPVPSEPEPGGRVVPGSASERTGRPSVRRAALAIGLLAFALRVWQPGPTTQTVDEFLWTLRSSKFETAVTTGDFSNASTSAVSGPEATQPGVTTMWAGTLARTLNSTAKDLNLTEDYSRVNPVDRSRTLRTGRSLVSLWCAMALAALVVVSARLVGRRAAIVAGVLLAAEPFLVGHSHLLHTDGLVTMFGALAIVAVAAANQRRDVTDRRFLIVAGVAAGVAVLTKLNAVPLVFGGVAVVLLAQADWRGGVAGALRRAAATGLAVLAIAFAVVFVAWPALWVDLFSQLGRLPGSVSNFDERATFFRMEMHAEPDPRYYLYALAFRLSPWLMVGAIVAIAATVVHLVATLGRRREPDGSHAGGGSSWPAPTVLVILLFATAPYLVLISRTGQMYDRYALPVVPFLALLTGVVAVVAADRWPRRLGARLLGPVALVGAVVIVGVTAQMQPFAISHVNPLVGGQERASRNILLGWGEGMERAGDWIKEQEHPDCKEIDVAATAFFGFIAMPCGRVEGAKPVDEYEYIIRYIGTTQRDPVDRFTPVLAERGRLVHEVKIGGFPYVEIWTLEG